VEYIPYGEVFVGEINNSFSTNYLFNAKELDNETGLYYYGARYLDPTGGMWLSVDPMWEKNIDATPYNYCHGNPITMVDPDGRENEVADIFSALPNEILSVVEPHIDDIMQLIDNGPDREYMAFGFEVTVDVDGDASYYVGVAGETSVTAGFVVFLGGPDAGYPYLYVGAEAGGGVCITSPDLSGDIGSTVSFFIAYNTTQNKDHSKFDGNYDYIRVTGEKSIGIPGTMFGRDKSGGISSAKGSDWTVWSFECTNSVSLSTPGSENSFGLYGTIGSGSCKFLNRSSVGKPKSFGDCVLGWTTAIPILG